MITERSELLSLNDLSNGKFGFSSFARGNQKSNRQQQQFKSSGPLKHPPWRGNSFNPNHLHRFNYLDNDEAANVDKRSEKIIKNLDRYFHFKMINKINIIFNFFLNQIESSIRNQSTKQAANNLKINKSEHYSNQKIIENLIEVNLFLFENT